MSDRPPSHSRWKKTARYIAKTYLTAHEYPLDTNDDRTAALVAALGTLNYPDHIPYEVARELALDAVCGVIRELSGAQDWGRAK
ncbi:hypothetical protein [Streptomyces shenzhenensis]|uniref:hypothetical protein n=1 Tax=Streptomyces shenzhenensis TaxID=943815 RepID=UPI0015F02F9A|nr:hypothetical protein [Streptomyces shenzhenensis]